MFRKVLATTAALFMFGGEAFAGDYQLLIKSAIIADSKANGAGWDAIGAPDPFVMAGVEVGKEVKGLGTTKVAQDTYRPSWNEAVTSADIGDDIIIQVWDKDVLSDDPIGEYKFTLTRRMIEDGETRVSFDQVKELRIVLRSK